MRSKTKSWMAGALVAGSCAALYLGGIPGLGAGGGEDGGEGEVAAGSTRTASPMYLASTVGGIPPTFGLAAGWSSPINANLLARGDFDGNQRTDLAGVGYDSATETFKVYLFLQSAAGVLGAPIIMPLPEGIDGFANYSGLAGTSIIGLTSGDFNEDGRSDLVLSDSFKPGIHALLSDAEGGFAWRSDVWTDMLPRVAARVADFDGDGHLDVVTSGSPADPDYWADPGYPEKRMFFFGNGLGDFPRHRADEVGGDANRLVIGDYDADGSPDVAEGFLGMDAHWHARVHRNGGTGVFLPPATLGVSALGYFDYVGLLEAGDFTGDQADDVLATSGEHLMVHAQLPGGTIQRIPTLFGAWTIDADSKIADIDGNGYPDAVSAYRYNAGVWLSLQDEYGLRHARKISFASVGLPSQYAPTALVVDDFNGDGIQDLAVSSTQHGIRVLHGSLKPYAGTGGLPGAPTVGTPVLAPGTTWPNHRVDVTVGPPTNDGGEPVTGYSVFSVPSGAVDADAGTLATTHRIYSLPNDTSYTFYARAHNAAGLGPPSAPSAALVIGTPKDPERAPALRLDWHGWGEGDAENVPWPITVRLDRPAPPGGVSFDVGVSGGTATAGVDFEFLIPPRITIPEGLMESAVITVQSLGDMQDEPDETFVVELTNVQGAAVTSYSESVTLYDDDQPGNFIALGGARVPEGDSGTTTAYASLMLSQPQPTDISVVLSADWCYLCRGEDFVPFDHLTVNIPAGQTKVLVPVVIMGDTEYEPTAAITVEFDSTPIQTAKYSQTDVYIVNDDPLPTISIGDATIMEGNQGPSAMKFTATLSAPMAHTVEFAARTVGGTAVGGSDYVERYLAGLVFEPGDTSVDFIVQAVGDVHVEPNESFTVQLEARSGATVADGTGVGTLQNDDVPNGLSVDDAVVVEGNGGGNSQLVFNVRLSEPSAGPVTFDIIPGPGSAYAPQDFAATPGLAKVIPAGSTLATFSVAVARDSEVEANETLVVELGNVVGATVVKRQALGRIFNDDQPTISVADATVTEPAEGQQVSAFFLVTLSAPASTPVQFSAGIVPITTQAGHDHVYAPRPNDHYWPDAPPTVFTIDAGRTSKLVEVWVFGDDVPEPTETYTLQITAPSGATIADGEALGTILDTDGQAAAASAAKRKLRPAAVTRGRR